MLVGKVIARRNGRSVAIALPRPPSPSTFPILWSPSLVAASVKRHP